MEDDLEEKVLKQACTSQMKLISRFAVGFFQSPRCTHFLRFMLRPEILFIAIIFFVFCFYLQAIELNANGFISRISNTLKFKSTKSISFTSSSAAEKDSWEHVKTQSAVYAVQGRRPRMEDR
jgi:protein phosphatase 1L